MFQTTDNFREPDVDTARRLRAQWGQPGKMLQGRQNVQRHLADCIETIARSHHMPEAISLRIHADSQFYAILPPHVEVRCLNIYNHAAAIVAICRAGGEVHSRVHRTGAETLLYRSNLEPKEKISILKKLDIKMDSEPHFPSPATKRNAKAVTPLDAVSVKMAEAICRLGSSEKRVTGVDAIRAHMTECVGIIAAIRGHEAPDIVSDVAQSPYYTFLPAEISATASDIFLQASALVSDVFNFGEPKPLTHKTGVEILLHGARVPVSCEDEVQTLQATRKLFRLQDPEGFAFESRLHQLSGNSYANADDIRESPRCKEYAFLPENPAKTWTNQVKFPDARVQGVGK